ncbi:MAG: hypothetical protein MJB57_05525 [Gemmatimonadetes bacterium]|nr:hypothetical protein [Gemmatimonadota bacterium]
MNREPGDYTPILMDLGKAKRKRVKKLKQGRGPLIRKIGEALDEHVAMLEVPQDAHIVPVIVVVEKKQKRRRRLIDLI